MALLRVGTFGLFGQQRDSLSAAFLLPLGLPWNLLIAESPESMHLWLVSFAPALRLALMAGLCRVPGRPVRR